MQAKFVRATISIGMRVGGEQRQMPVALSGTHMHVSVRARDGAGTWWGHVGDGGMGVCGRYVCVHVVGQVYV